MFHLLIMQPLLQLLNAVTFDLAWFGGLTGVQARNVVPEAEAIAQRPMDKEFHSVFIAGADTGIKSV